VSRAVISDCEGPISKNDNAYEIASHYIPDGDRLFTVISKYDDVLADTLKRPDYKAGSTLKFILPFLKAYDVTDEKIQRFSSKSLRLIPSIKDTLRYIREIAHVFIVSTSYEHYIKALCKTIDFPYENTYCTNLCIDKYHIMEEEKVKLKKIAKEIAKMPIVEIPAEAKHLKDFSEKDQETILQLDAIFKEIADMNIGKIFHEINPVGGCEKAEAVKDAAQKTGVSLMNVMYVGDSITDLDAFRLVRENGGLTVSFNGNRYAIANAEIAILSEHSIITTIIADAFSRLGKEQALNLVENWNHKALEKSRVNKALLSKLFSLYPQKLPKVKIITNENMESLAKESIEFREKVRGKAIGRLG